MIINTSEAIATMLDMKQFKFEAINNVHKEDNIKAIKQCLDLCKVVCLEDRLYYRARNIFPDSKGIIFCEGVPQNGYNEKDSGVAPIDYCNYGRANDKYEQVLYISEDAETTIKEVRTEVGYYVSVATCKFEGLIKVFDFSPYSEKQLSDYIISSELSKKQGGKSLIYMYMEIQRILTLPEYSENEYVVSRDLVRIIKEQYPDISGIIYSSQFTGKKNIAVWDENKFVSFTEGKVILLK